VVEDRDATVAFEPRADIVRNMVNRGIAAFTRQTNAPNAWRTLVATQDIVGIKVFSAPGAQVGTRTAVVASVIEGLLAAGLPANHLIVWDRRLSDLHSAGYSRLAQEYGIALRGALDSGWDETASYDSALLGQLIYGDLEFNKEGSAGGRKSYVTKLVTRQLTKIINVTPLLNHNSVGVSGNLYGLAMGSVDNTLRFEGDAGKLAEAVPEIYALSALGDRVVLNIVDALVCQYEGEKIGRLHNSTELNQIRFSLDPVALDFLSVEEIRTQRRRAFGTVNQTNRIDLLENAALLELGTTSPGRINLQTLRLSHP
jgi:hypothetical protein